MKTINKYIFGAVALAATSLTSCVEDADMLTGTVTVEQVQSSPTAVKSMALGLPARQNLMWSEDSHCYFGYAAEMIVRDIMTGDYLHAGETGYSHFISWGRNTYMGDAWMKTQFHWNYYYGNILAANNVCAAVNPDDATQEQLGYYAVGKAYRAMWYLDMARMYEFLPNDKFDAATYKHILNKTVPLVTEQTTAEEAGNNPRASREVMAQFIENDLNEAEEYIGYLADRNSNTLPDLACVYGLKARLYMWLEDYEKARDYARLARENATVAPITEAKATDPKTGYNVADDFMWAAVQTAENRTITSGIMNWTSWVSNQTTFGYTGPSTALYVYMDKSLYERISESDWRKYQWVAPDDALKAKCKFISASDAANIPAYASLKFRPVNAEAADYKIGAASAYPIMRVEEMYLIEAEAAEHVEPGTGIDLLAAFMKAYRNSEYTFRGSDAIAEIILQKRIELWGEGQTFFDIKRLNMSVTRGYAGTNWGDEQCRLNTNGRPAWTNFVMVRSEAANNKGLEGMNNPDPTDCYTPWAE